MEGREEEREKSWEEETGIERRLEGRKEVKRKERWGERKTGRD